MSLISTMEKLGRPVAYYPSIARALGGDPSAAIFLCQFIYWRSKVGDREIYKSREEILEETGLGVDAQKRICTKLKSLKLVTITKKGLPARNYYSFNWANVDSLLADSAPTSEGEMPQLDRAKPHDNKGLNTPTISETTAKTTTEINNKSKPTPRGLVANTPFEQELIDYRKAIKKPLKTQRGLTGLVNSIEQTAKAWNVHQDVVRNYMMQKEWQSIEPSYSNPYITNTNQQKTAANNPPAPAINYFTAKVAENDAEEAKKAAQALKELLEGKL